MPALKQYPDELRERAIRFAPDLVDGPEQLSVKAATAWSALHAAIRPPSAIPCSLRTATSNAG